MLVLLSDIFHSGANIIHRLLLLLIVVSKLAQNFTDQVLLIVLLFQSSGDSLQRFNLQPIGFRNSFNRLGQMREIIKQLVLTPP